MINWDKIETDIDNGGFSEPVEFGPNIQWQYQRLGSMTYCSEGNFVGIFLEGAPIHSRIPVEAVLTAAETIKREILFRKFK